jgi:Glyoxalase-like domain
LAAAAPRVAVWTRSVALGARLLEDRSDDPEEPLRVYADPAGHPFRIIAAIEPPELGPGRNTTARSDDQKIFSERAVVLPCLQ